MIPPFSSIRPFGHQSMSIHGFYDLICPRQQDPLSSRNAKRLTYPDPTAELKVRRVRPSGTHVSAHKVPRPQGSQPVAVHGQRARSHHSWKLYFAAPVPSGVGPIPSNPPRPFVYSTVVMGERCWSSFRRCSSILTTLFGLLPERPTQGLCPCPRVADVCMSPRFIPS